MMFIKLLNYNNNYKKIIFVIKFFQCFVLIPEFSFLKLLSDLYYTPESSTFFYYLFLKIFLEAPENKDC